MFSNSGSIRVYIALKNKLIKQLNTVIEPGEESERALDNANLIIQRMVQVSDLAERELKYDKDFDKNCIVLSSYANEPVDKVSIRRYFTMIEHYNAFSSNIIPCVFQYLFMAALFPPLKSEKSR